MNLEQVKHIIKKGESATVEFKKTTGQLRAAFETICAFLNNKGGVVLIGITDDKKIVGQNVVDSTKRDIAQEIAKIEPPANISLSYIHIDKDKQVIVIEIAFGKHAPYTYDGRPYWREESSTHRMPQQRYDQLVAKRFQLNFSWEELLAENYSLTDLDDNLIISVARQSVAAKRMPENALRQDVEKILEGLKLIANHHLKNAAIALFAKEPFSTYPQCQLKLARFKGIDRHEFLDSDQLYGNVFALLERAMLFVQRHLPIASKIEPGKIQRIETPIIPYDAIREALVNSLCHRDYSAHGGSIALAIYEDRMEISNHGGLLPNLTLTQIKSGFSEPRNPLIAEVFYRCKMIEKWGRGIPEIIKSCLVANDPEPEFFNTKAEFKVIFRFPNTIKPSVILINEEKEKLAKISKRQQQIINILAQVESLSAQAIFLQLKEKFSLRTIKGDLTILKNIGLIEQWGKARKTLWKLVK